MQNQIIVYNNGELELKVSVENETIWLTQKQIALLFEKDLRTVNEHIKAIYKEEELLEDSTIRKFRIVQKEGKREVSRDVLHYNLDVIISVGYRVNSKKATQFRKWATSILKQYISNGYVINSDKITHERFKELENSVSILQNQMKLLEKKTIKPFKNAHDRFLVIDKTEVYHIGASFKDLGKKWFAFSKMDVASIGILERLGEK